MIVSSSKIPAPQDKNLTLISRKKLAGICFCYLNVENVKQKNRPFATVGHVTCFSRTH